MPHTVGPWEIEHQPDGQHYIVAPHAFGGPPASGLVVAQVPWHVADVELQANAHLIASAPALANVARAAQWLTEIGTTPDGGIIVGPQGWAKLQEALAQLRGEVE